MLQKNPHYIAESECFGKKTDIYNKEIMDKKLVYKRLMEHAAQRGIIEGQYTEIHHVRPKCLGGGNEPSNLVYLTAKEHFIAHLLLHRIDVTNASLACAYWALCGWKSKGSNRWTPSARAYAEARLARASHMWKPVYIYKLDGTYHAEYHSVKEAAKNLGVTPQTLSTALKKGYKTSNYLVSSEKHSKIKPYEAKTKTRKVYKFDLTGCLVTMFNSVTEAARAEATTPARISGVVHKHNRHHKGFIYSFDDKVSAISVDPARLNRKRYDYVNVETGEVYKSMRLAERAIGRTSNSKAFKAMFTKVEKSWK